MDCPAPAPAPAPLPACLVCHHTHFFVETRLRVAPRFHVRFFCRNFLFGHTTGPEGTVRRDRDRTASQIKG